MWRIRVDNEPIHSTCNKTILNEIHHCVLYGCIELRQSDRQRINFLLHLLNHIKIQRMANEPSVLKLPFSSFFSRLFLLFVRFGEQCEWRHSHPVQSLQMIRKVLNSKIQWFFFFFSFFRFTIHFYSIKYLLAGQWAQIRQWKWCANVIHRFNFRLFCRQVNRHIKKLVASTIFHILYRLSVWRRTLHRSWQATLATLN